MGKGFTYKRTQVEGSPCFYNSYPEHRAINRDSKELSQLVDFLDIVDLTFNELEGDILIYIINTGLQEDIFCEELLWDGSSLSRRVTLQ